MSATGWLLVALGAGLGTYALRAIPFLLMGRYSIGDKGLKFLVYTAMTLFAGIVSKSLIMWKGPFDPWELAIKLAALLVALGVYKKFRHVLLSLFTGVSLAVILKLLAT